MGRASESQCRIVTPNITQHDSKIERAPELLMKRIADKIRRENSTTSACMHDARRLHYASRATRVPVARHVTARWAGSCQEVTARKCRPSRFNQTAAE